MTLVRLLHYEITSLLGKGGVEEVYQAKDGKLGRDFARKAGEFLRFRLFILSGTYTILPAQRSSRKSSQYSCRIPEPNDCACLS